MFTAEEQLQIENEFEALLNDYSGTRNGDKSDLIRRVFRFAEEAHRNQRRLSGEPYILHPLAVARIVASEIGLGSTSISVALLHDVVKLSDHTFEEIEAAFGSKIGELVRDVHKLAGKNVRFVTEETADPRHPAIKNPEEQAENFRNFLLTMSNDVRVILVKIADRLHNMRTLGNLEPLKQKRIASETLFLYAPIAYRLGLFNIKSQLEDLSLRYEHPTEYKAVQERLQKDAAIEETYFATFAAPIHAKLIEMGFEYSVKTRMKSVFSIWRKMQKKGCTYDEIYDIFAERVVFTPRTETSEKDDCWKIFRAITDLYSIKPDRTRDWITRPKDNGYEALHVTVQGPKAPEARWIEVQIRSERMNEIDEKGIAAHWKYKRGNEKDAADSSLDQWFKTIKEILDNPAPNATEFLNAIKLNVLSTSIYVFTPTGDLREIPKGATALDFAFALHTDIGMHAEAVRINHKIAPLNTVLQSGQQVEVITATETKVSEKWRKWVHTPKAKNCIDNYFKKQRQLVVSRGEKMLKDYFEPLNIPLDTDTMNALLSHYGMHQWDDLYCAFGNGDLAVSDNLRKIVHPRKGFLGFLGFGQPTKEKQPKKKKQRPQKGKPQETPASSTLELKGIDSKGLLNQITVIIAKTCTANILNIHLECKDGLFRGYITLDTNNDNDILRLLAELKKLHEIENATRKN